MSPATRPGGRDLLRRFKGEVITCESTGYDKARRIWNRDADKRPLAVVRPVDDDDVAAAVRFAQEAGLVTSVRCGGHSYQGHSTNDDGLVIDLAPQMGGVQLDAAANVVRSQGGALLGAVDRATVPADRVMPAGIVSHTGLGGLALGGGIGYLTRSFGLTCDQFLRLRVVTASGEVVHASEDEHPDLFWALRGGGGNFGIVTGFKCRTHKLGPVQSGPLFYPMNDATDVIHAMAGLMWDAPRELSLNFSLAVDRDRFGDLLRGADVGDRVLMVYVVYRGGPEDEPLRRVREIREPVVDLVRADDFLLVQQRLDQVSQHSVGWYMKSGHARELSLPLIEKMVDSSMQYASVRAPDVQREAWVIQSLGGAASDITDDATAYSGRGAQWHAAIEVGFMTQEERDRIVTWTKNAWNETKELLDLDTSYVNMNFEEGKGALEDVYGAGKLGRLRAVKTAYDPGNFFRMNTNIAPVEV